MAQFTHPNIVTLHGVVSDKEPVSIAPLLIEPLGLHVRYADSATLILCNFNVSSKWYYTYLCIDKSYSWHAHAYGLTYIAYACGGTHAKRRFAELSSLLETRVSILSFENTHCTTVIVI